MPKVNTLEKISETDDSVEALLDRVRALQPLIRENAAKGEQDRRVPEPVIAALKEAGAFRLGTPRRFGGYQGNMKAFLDLSSIVAEADGGTAWVVTLVNVCNFFAGLFSESAKEKIFGANPDALISGVHSASATSRKVEGGYRVTGKWFYNSAGWHSDWALLGIPLVDDEGKTYDRGWAIIPASELKLEDTWFVAGMAASGSISRIAEDVFVPDDMVASVSEAIKGGLPEMKLAGEPEYSSAVVPVFSLVLIGPQLGLGRAALDFVTSKAPTKAIYDTVFTSATQSVGFQLQIAKAATLIETAHLHAYKCAEEIDAAALAGVYPTTKARAKMRAHVATVAESITQAIDALLFAHGASSFALNNPLQRIWRDSAVGARHAAITPQIAYETWGKELLGISDHVTPLV
ncbi:acyl-CoA dehydrogenase family protein [Sphingobium sp. H39-3-25]|jgi:alkylation response protein AidB-like acyl-CoA dehydrogenase|uniref:acyl-CoA dehydrogenase family protein n=1 Tax=Sphingomonadales TaxID=204457 RepID=UPI00082F8CD2|nr:MULTISPECIES: acyl-CoA dehydrogenase family protein [Sphingomonadaceae]MDF0488864.1 acyl-CoA dehydrogenase family protein [Sphingomonas pollutisoli]MDF0546669.1 acyl-CoA dehydrogenase family protein [Sphingobium arseniciresistens]